MPRALSDLFLLPAIGLIAVSATIHVPGDVATLAEAIDASTSGDTIELACGTHGAANLTVPHDLVVRSGTGNAECSVIDAGGTGYILDVAAGVRLVLQGVSLTGADIVAVRQIFGRLELYDCVVADNRATIWAIVQTDTLVAERCTFRGNDGCAVTAWGPATVTDCVFRANLDGGLRLTSSGVVTGCAFEDNRGASAGGLGASLHGPVEITSCRFESNVVTGWGGALASAQSGYGSMTVAASTFRRNVAAGGGAVCLNYAGRTIMTDCVFEENEAGRGGALLGRFLVQPARFERCSFRGNGADLGGTANLEYAHALFVGSTFFDNVAAVEGGVAWVDRRSRADFYRSTLCGNASGGQGGGLWVQYGPDVSVSLVNTIVAFSRSGAALASDSPAVRLDVRCTDIFGNPGGDWIGALVPHAGGEGNFSANPLFCDFIHGDLRLFEASPCLPEATGCGRVGAWDAGCGIVGIRPLSWARLKSAYRD